MSRAQRWVAAQLWRASGRPVTDRELLYDGATGLRIVTFHETPPEQLERLRRIVDWCGTRFPMASPADVDGLVAGRWRTGPDRVLLTFDDGYESNFEAAVILLFTSVARRGFEPLTSSLKGRRSDFSNARTNYE